MNKKLFLSLTAGAIALFQACSGDVVELNSNAEQPIQTTAKLTVTVQDAVSGEILDSAEVSLNNGKPQATNSNGVATFTDVSTGRHQLFIERGRYAAMFQEAVVSQEEDTQQKNIYIARDTISKVQLYPLTAGLTGEIYYTDKDGIGKPVPAGINVFIQYSNQSLVKRLDSVKTTTGGKYAFVGQPSVGTGFTLWAEGKTIDGIPFGTLSIPRRASLQGSISNFNERTTYTLGTYDAVFVVKSYNNPIKNNEPLKIAFSDKVNLAYFTSNTVTIGSEVADPKWSADSTELTLTPVGKWKSSFNLSGTLRSISGKTLSMNSSIGTITVLHDDLSGITIEPRLVTKPENIAHSNSGVTLRWKKVEGVNDNDYSVYCKTEGENQDGYVTCSRSLTIDADSITAAVSFTAPISYRTVSILVQASNVTSKTKLDPKKAIEIKDGQRPTTSYGSQGWVIDPASFPNPISDGGKLTYEPVRNYSFGEYEWYLENGLTMRNALANSPAEKYYGCIQIPFDEPMDTTVALTVEWKSAENANTANTTAFSKKVTIDRKWGQCPTSAINAANGVFTQDDQYLSLWVGTVASDVLGDGKEVNAIYSISGLKDKSQGNKLSMIYPKGQEGSLARDTVDVLDIRFIYSVVELP